MMKRNAYMVDRSEVVLAYLNKSAAAPITR